MAMALTDSAGVSGLPGGPGGNPGAANLPPGTYGQLRDSDGNIINAGTFAYGQTDLPTPVLPATLPVPSGAGYRIFTAKATSGGSGFRVLVENFSGAVRVLVVAIPLDETRQTLSRLVVIEVVVSLVVLGALAVAAWLLIKRDLRPLETMAVTADAIAAGDLAQRVQPAEPRTEVGRLGLSLNTMLSRIEEAFAERAATEEKLRRFLADASHELRTPLTSIRGYSEVFDRAKDDPEDLELAMRRIEEESKRMGVMVEELLVLARLGEGREPERAPVDLARVVDDAVSDARASAPARDIALERVGDRGRAGRRPPAPPGRRQPPRQRSASHARRGAGPRDGLGPATAAHARRRRRRPRARAGRGRQGVRALLPCGRIACPPNRRRRPRPRHRRRHRGGSRRRGAARHGPRRRRHVHGDAAAGRRAGAACGRLGGARAARARPRHHDLTACASSSNRFAWSACTVCAEYRASS